MRQQDDAEAIAAWGYAPVALVNYSTALVPRGSFLVELAEREAKHKAPMKAKRNMRTLMEPPLMATPDPPSIAAWGHSPKLRGR